MPQVPPSFAQCLQYLQFLHALHGSLPVHVEKDSPVIAPSKNGVARTASNKLPFLSTRNLLQGTVDWRLYRSARSHARKIY